MQKKYELNVFMKPTLSNEEIAKITGKVQNYIAESKGEILEKKEPEKRKLPYVVKKFRDCYYYYVKFAMDSLAVAAVSEKVRLTEDVIRYMVSSAVEIEIKEAEEPKPAAPATEVKEAAPAPKQETGTEGAGV